VEAVTSQGAGALDVPFAASQCVETQLFDNLGDAHHSHVLLVGKHQEHGILELVLSQHLLEFLASDLNSFLVGGVDHIDKGLSVLVVVLPELSDFILSSNVPDGELDLLELNGFNIEADGGHGGDDLTELELVEDGGLAGGVQTEHERSEFLLSEERVEQLGET
jgi:hypothetical protein